jgi:hypothetical protein
MLGKTTYYLECHCAEYRDLFIVILNVLAYFFFKGRIPKTSFILNLRLDLKSYSVCYWQAFWA